MTTIVLKKVKLENTDLRNSLRQSFDKDFIFTNMPLNYEIIAVLEKTQITRLVVLLFFL